MPQTTSAAQEKSIVLNDTNCFNAGMKTKRWATETELAGLAKKYRTAAGLNKAEAGRQLGVRRGTVHQAEDYPEISLTRFRIRMIEKFGGMRVEGPLFRIRKGRRA